MNIDTKDLIDMLKLAGIGHSPSAYELPSQDLGADSVISATPGISMITPITAEPEMDQQEEPCKCQGEDLLVPNEIMDQEECEVCAATPCCCAELGFMDESADYHNGYDNVKDVDAKDYFPTGEHGTPATYAGPSGARHGNNPMSTSMKVSETLEEKYIRQYEAFLKEDEDDFKSKFLKSALTSPAPTPKAKPNPYSEIASNDAKEKAISWANKNLHPRDIDNMSFMDLFLKLVELKLDTKS